MSRYEIVGLVGRGGMGAVYKAIQRPLGRPVAYKLRDRGAFTQPELLARFRREVQSSMSLAHPNIIKILDYGEEDGQPFYAMELLEDARTLAQLVRDEGALAPGRAAGIMDQLLDALAYCHERGFIHRDVKPANVMVRADGRVVLMDFGLVRATQRTVLTQEGQVLGTPRYTAPDVLRGAAAMAGSDVYSAGLIFYELITARLAYEAPSLPELLRVIMTTEPEAPSRVRADLPAGTDELFRAMTARDPARRLAKAGEAREAIAAWGASAGQRRPGPGRAAAGGGPSGPNRVGGRIAPVDAPVPPRRRSVAIAAGLLLAAVVAVGLWPRAPAPPPVPGGSPAVARESSRPAALALRLAWGTTRVVAAWRSVDAHAAYVEVRPSAARSPVSTREARPSREHRVVVTGLPPATSCQVVGRLGPTLLFEDSGHTASARDAGARLVSALTNLGAWGLLRQMRHEAAQVRRPRKGPAARAAPRLPDAWRSRLEGRLSRSGIPDAVQDFEPVRDAFYGDRTVPLDLLLALYGQTCLLRELEEAAGTMGVGPRPLWAATFSARHGPALGPSLVRPESYTLEWRRGTYRSDPPDGGRGPVVDAHDSDRLETFGDHRKANPMVPGRVVVSVAIAHVETEVPFPLPLPEPGEVEAAEIHASLEAGRPTNPLRIFLTAPGGPPRLVAVIRNESGRIGVPVSVWHGLDPRVLAPGARLMIDLVYCHEDPQAEQSVRLRYLSFRWTRRRQGPQGESPASDAGRVGRPRSTVGP